MRGTPGAAAAGTPAGRSTATGAGLWAALAARSLKVTAPAAARRWRSNGRSPYRQEEATPLGVVHPEVEALNEPENSASPSTLNVPGGVLMTVGVPVRPQTKGAFDLGDPARRADRIAAGKDQPSDLELDRPGYRIDGGLAAERRPRLAAAGDPAGVREQTRVLGC